MGLNVQVNCDPPSPQVIDPQDTADDVSSEVVEDEDFPYGFPICVEDWGGFGDEAVGRGSILCGIWGDVIEVEDALDGS